MSMEPCGSCRRHLAEEIAMAIESIDPPVLTGRPGVRVPEDLDAYCHDAMIKAAAIRGMAASVARAHSVEGGRWHHTMDSLVQDT